MCGRSYVPEHLRYTLFELLKNSCRAVVEAHGDRDGGSLPDVRVVVSRGDEDITVKVRPAHLPPTHAA